MSGSGFDIYQTDRSYVAVTNETRRLILDEMRLRDADLPRLMEVTGKSKPTLSSVHLRALLADGLVAEIAHPHDRRRKIYRLRARRIGASDVPLDDLRGAVREYAGKVALGPTVPLGRALEIVSSEGTPDDVLRHHARLIGQESAALFELGELPHALDRIASILEKAGVARTRRLEPATCELELEALPRAPRNTRVSAATLGAFFEGVLSAAGLASRATGRAIGGARVLVSVERAVANVSQNGNILDLS